MALGVASGLMAQALDIARAIHQALSKARSAGAAPAVIVVDDATRDRLQRAGLGYWAAGPATWSLFNVPVVTGLVSGWRLRLASEGGTPRGPHGAPSPHP